MNLRPLAACLSLAACAFTAHAAENELTAAEKKAGWTLLFDGKTLNGWRPYANKPAGGWEVVDGTLHAIAKVKGTELITEKKFHDFEFSWEWKVPVAGNNGVKYLVTEARTGAPGEPGAARVMRPRRTFIIGSSTMVPTFMRYCRTTVRLAARQPAGCPPWGGTWRSRFHRS